MTVIAAWAQHGEIWMAADTMGVDGDGRIWPGMRKIHTVAVPADGWPQSALIGVTGNRRLSTLAQRNLKIDQAPNLDDADDTDAWADAIAEALDALAFDARQSDSSGDIPGRWLLGYGGRLWLLGYGSAVPVHRYTAIGAGGDLALGALHALTPYVDGGHLAVEDALRAACSAAHAYDNSCGADVTIHHWPEDP